MVRSTKEFGVKISIVFFITVLVFLLGMAFGDYLNQKKIERIEMLEKDISIKISDLELLNKIFLKEPCKNRKYLNYLGSELDKEAIRLDYLEESLGKKNKKVIGLKKPYTLLLLKHFFAMEKLKSECKENIITVLFFYSNSEPYQGLSENEGIILGFIKNKYDSERIKIYALDVDLNLQSVEYLKEKYNITSIPSLVINDEVFGYLEKDELENVISGIL